MGRLIYSTYPLADPKSELYKHLKRKRVILMMADKDLGTDHKGNIYKIENGIAKKLE